MRRLDARARLAYRWERDGAAGNEGRVPALRSADESCQIAMNQCQVCLKRTATVHITEVLDYQTGAKDVPAKVRQSHFCEQCAHKLKVPYMPVAKKAVVDIFKLLTQSAQRTRRDESSTCQTCGMTLNEFRIKGRLGCPECYEAFARFLHPLLLRMHNATRHAGRIPGLDEEELRRIQHISELRERLQAAVREEKYERAAQLRDELQTLESESPTTGSS